MLNLAKRLYQTQASEPTQIVYIDRVLTGQEYVIRLWRECVERSEHLRQFNGTEYWLWKSVANQIYTTMARPWFEEEQKL